MASDGDIRVLLAMNLLLSAAFGSLVVWGLSYIGAMAFTLRTVGGAVAVLFVLTYLLVLR